LTALLFKVKPGAPWSRLKLLDDGTWLAEVKAPPVDGKANAAVIALVAAHFGVPRSAVAIKSGAASKLKRVVIAD
jgi:uncharacterized protein